MSTTTTVGVEERLFFLSASDGQVLSMSTDGADRKILVEGQRLPDGIVVDAPADHLYWTNMGVPDRNDGSVTRCDVDGRNVTPIVPPGGTHTPKQIVLDRPNRRLYWADREGMRMTRCNLDGSAVEANGRKIVVTDSGALMVVGDDGQPSRIWREWHDCVELTRAGRS